MQRLIEMFQEALFIKVHLQIFDYLLNNIWSNDQYFYIISRSVLCIFEVSIELTIIPHIVEVV